MFKIGDVVIVENKTKCQIIDIVEEDGIEWYEVKPIEFISFSRHVLVKNLSKSN